MGHAAGECQPWAQPRLTLRTEVLVSVAVLRQRQGWCHPGIAKGDSWSPEQ